MITLEGNEHSDCVSILYDNTLYTHDILYRYYIVYTCVYSWIIFPERIKRTVDRKQMLGIVVQLLYYNRIVIC